MPKAFLSAGVIVGTFFIAVAHVAAGPSTKDGSKAGLSGRSAATADGSKLFETNCSACHQSSGQGIAGQFPPLAGNSDLFLSRTFPANVVLFGLQGEIKTEGKMVASVMPPVAYLSDAEIAAVLHYVRTAWGNDKLRPPGFKPLDAAAVAEVRKHPLSPDQVRELRARLKAGTK
ncbi:MAG TPA: cytochrome c [Pseudolabrys sp.]|nr:cytochrome c [Pseudolabrys sp.]